MGQPRCGSGPAYGCLLAAACLSTAALAADGEAAVAVDGRKDPCRGELEARQGRLDRVRGEVFTGVCAASRWFDGLFGDARDYSDSYGETYGRFGFGLSWDELDDVTLDSHFRANVNLPALGDRFDAVLGRDSDDNFIADDYDETGLLAGSFSDDRDANWYAGLNYNAISGANSGFNLGAGVQLRTPLNPYLKARYRYYAYPRSDVRLAFRATAFWENSDGLGLTLSGDSDWALGRDFLVRWTNGFTISEVTEGVRWKSRLSLNQLLGAKSALRYEASVRGETDGVQPDFYGARLTYRRSVWREWLFIETHTGVFWTDSVEPDRVCDACLTAGIGFEMLFGERYEGWLDRARTTMDDDTGTNPSASP